MKSISGIVLCSMIILITSDAGFAQKRSAEWILGVDKGAQEELGLKKAPRIASVPAKGGRSSSLVLDKCKKNSIDGRFDDDPTINLDKLAGRSDAKTIYISYDGVTTVPTEADGGYAPWYISLPAPPRNATTINLQGSPVCLRTMTRERRRRDGALDHNAGMK